MRSLKCSAGATPLRWRFILYSAHFSGWQSREIPTYWIQTLTTQFLMYDYFSHSKKVVI